MKTRICILLLASIHFSYSQNVGIGTNDPLEKLHVSGGNLSIENGLSSFPWLSFRNNNALKGYIGVQSDNLRIGTWPGTNPTGHIALVTNNFDRIRIMPDGNVGLATSSPRGLFDIGGGDEGIYLASNTILGNQRIAYLPGDLFLAPWAGTNISYLEARRSNSSGNTNLQFRTYQNGVGRDALFMSEIGKVGIRNSAPGGTLEVRQLDNDGFVLRSPNNETWEQEISYDANGFPPPHLNFVFNGTQVAFVNRTTGTWNPVSDMRLKKQITGLTPVLHRLLQLRPSTFEMIQNNPNHQRSVGFIAQEVQRLFPESVLNTETYLSREKDPLLALDFSALTTICIKAIQEQQAVIDSLIQRIEQLEKRLKK